jgi:uncharacterized protein
MNSSMNPELNTWQLKLVALAGAAAGSDGAHDISHLHRVWRNAQALLESYPQADRLVVMAGCYLHDLVNLPKNHPDRAMASRRSAALASSELAAQGFPAARIGAVAHAIEAHSFSAAIEAKSIEAQIVQDADRLDALGAVGLARMFYIAGQMGIALAHPDDPLAESRPRDDRAFALDHIEAKLAALPGKMQTAAGRALGEERLEQLLAFRCGFAREWIGAGAP